MNIPKPKIQKPTIKLSRPKFDRKAFGIVVTLIKKELFNFFSTPLAYIILALFVAVVAILFFAVGKFLQVGTADLSNLFAYISFSFVIIVPAITMGSISREKQSGTIEYLLTQPLTEVQLLLAKFISYSIFVLILLATTIPLVFMIGINGPLDVGQVVMQYIGAFVLGMCLISLGIAVSALLKSEIASFLTSVVLAAVLIIIGSDLVQIKFGLDFIIEKVGLLAHYQSISRGVLDIRDALYFVAFIFAFLSIAFYLLIKDKFPARDKSLQYARLSLVVLIMLTVLIGYIGQIIPGRIDFTTNKIYTLSDASVNIIRNADDLVTIKLFASDNLPLEFKSQIKTVQDVLRDYQTYSSGKIKYDFVETAGSTTTDTENEASKAGLQPIRFQVSDTDSSQVVMGYFGITFNYLDKSDLLNLSDQSTLTNIEYNVTKKINKLTNKNLKTIGFANSSVSYTLGAQNLQTLSTELNELFTVQEVDLTQEIPSTLNTLVIAGPNAAFTDEQKANIVNYFSTGGRVFLLTNPVTVDAQSFTSSNNDNSLRDLFADYGITVNQNLVYDLENNNLVNAGFVFPINYPLWVIAQPSSEDISILKDVNEVSYLWGSSISVDGSKTDNVQIHKLLETSGSANAQQTGGYNLAPDQEFAQKSDDSVLTLGVAIENASKGKAVIIGDSKIISDDYSLITSNENLAFTLGSIEWLSGSDAIGNIQAKVRTSPRISLDSTKSTTLTVVGIGLPIGAIIVFGVARFYFRKRKQEKKYE